MSVVQVDDLPRKPRWHPLEAAAYAAGQVRNPDKWYEGLCDHFVTWCYGYQGSGYYDARTHLNSIPDRFRHWGHEPPVGAFCWWNTGTHQHVAFSVGRGRVASTDILRLGRVDIVSIGALSARWNVPYLGWSEPWVQNCWGLNPNHPPNVKPRKTELRQGVKPGHRHPQVVDIKAVFDQLHRQRGHDVIWGPGERTSLYGTRLQQAVVAFHNDDGKKFARGRNDDTLGPGGWNHLQELIGR